jgi:hypothetical protein
MLSWARMPALNGAIKQDATRSPYAAGEAQTAQ